MSDLDLITLTNRDPQFYPLIGPFLGRRDVHKALGGAPFDDEGKTWIAARRDGRIVGIISVHTRRRGLATAESCFTEPEHDDVRGALITAVIDAVAPTPVSTTVRTDVADAYRAAGFAEVNRVGKNFVHLARKES